MVKISQSSPRRGRGLKVGRWGNVAAGVFGLVAAGCGGPSAQTQADLAAAGASRAGQLARVEGTTRLALGGYDPVAYFTEGQPVAGRDEWTAQHDGATYRFASDEHRQRFLAEPERYTPAYGGWCATAMADGQFVDADPTNFRVQSNRLFVFYRLLVIDATGPWDQNPAGLARDADRHWRELAAAPGAAQ